MAQAVLDEPILADESELSRLRALAERLAASPAATLLGADDEPLLLPDSAYRALLGVIRALARGDAVAITPIDAALTVRQAANLLAIPEPAVAKLLETGELPARSEDTRRPVRLVDLLAYRQRRSRTRRELLDEMLREAQELGLYDDEYPAPPDSDH